MVTKYINCAGTETERYRKQILNWRQLTIMPGKKNTNRIASNNTSWRSTKRPVKTIKRVLWHSCHGSHEHDVRKFAKKCLWHKLLPRLGRTSILRQGMSLCLSWKPTIFGSFRGNTALPWNIFIACLLTVHSSEHHVLGYRVRLYHGICSIVCTGLKKPVALTDDSEWTHGWITDSTVPQTFADG